jgi:hypothetical protein
MLRGFGDPASAERRRVLRETIEAFERAAPPDRFHRSASDNLARWKATASASSATLRVEVHPGDWGDVTSRFARAYGECFAVLTMANATVPGGAYVEGAPAQEENMFRRTDCHFHVGPHEYDAGSDRYVPAMTRLISARDGVVYLDRQKPRVCIRGSEDRSRPDLGYRWLGPDEVYPFYELRAAAEDLRDGSPFDADETRRRISAQLETLRRHGLRHAVLGAFGCGAFRNPAERVAEIYKEEIERRRDDFSIVAFAIFAPGYGPDNYQPFASMFREQT